MDAGLCSSYPVELFNGMSQVLCSILQIKDKTTAPLASMVNKSHLKLLLCIPPRPKTRPGFVLELGLAHRSLFPYLLNTRPVCAPPLQPSFAMTNVSRPLLEAASQQTFSWLSWEENFLNSGPNTEFFAANRLALEILPAPFQHPRNSYS